MGAYRNGPSDAPTVSTNLIRTSHTPSKTDVADLKADIAATKADVQEVRTGLKSDMKILKFVYGPIFLGLLLKITFF